MANGTAPIRHLYLLNHCHVDLGYTDHVAALWPFFDDAIVRAMDLVEDTLDHPPEARFRYTCEVLCIVDHFLRHAGPRQVDRFLAHARAGRIDIGAMWAHFTPLVTRAEMHWTMDEVRRLRRDYGLTIQSAMSNDVNGLPWPWVDALLEAEITGFTMGINEHRGRSPLRPRAYWWQGPGGGKLLTWCGENYNWGRWYGVPQDVDQAIGAFDAYLARLAAGGYACPFVCLQTTGELNWGDNNWPSEHLSAFVRTWNQRAGSPRAEIVTLTGFLDRLRSHLDQEPATVIGDWSDWWALGVGTMPRLTALLRQTQQRIALCRRLLDRPEAARQRGGAAAQLDRATRLCLLFSEHTWASDEAAARPDSAFTEAVCCRKACYVLDAATLVEQVHQQIGSAVRGALKVGPDQAVVVNPHGDRVSAPIGLTSNEARSTVQNPPQMVPRDVARALEDGFETPPMSLAAGAVRTLPRGTAQQVRWQVHAGELAVANGHGRVVLCPTTGAVVAWCDASGRERIALEDQGLNRYVHESVEQPDGRGATWRGHDGWRPDGWGRHGSPDVLKRQGPTRVVGSERGESHGRMRLRLHLAAVGVEALSLTYHLHADGAGLDMVNRLELPPDPAPRSIYFVFAPKLTGGSFWYDAAGTPTRACAQVPGSCHDYVCVGDWAAVSAAERTLMLHTPDAPLLQLGDFSYLRLRPSPLEQTEPTRLISWPANNHWEVNFPIRSPGRLTLRYTVRLAPGGATAHALAEQAEGLRRGLCWFPYVRYDALWRAPAGPARVVSDSADG